MTGQIRVVVANKPRLMRELVVETIREQPDIEIVAEIQNEQEISRVVDETRPNFLIITLNESNEPSIFCDILLRRHPEMKILALAPERNIGIFYWATLDIHTGPVESSEAGILERLRAKSVHAGGST